MKHFVLKPTRQILIIQKNVKEVFELDRIEDWKAFFQKYPELEEPQLVDLESEASITEEGSILKCFLLFDCLFIPHFFH